MRLEVQFPNGAWKHLGRELTDAGGRAGNLLPASAKLTKAVYRLTFDKLPAGLFPEIMVSFRVRDLGRSYHIPLLYSSYGYTTYRGS